MKTRPGRLLKAENCGEYRMTLYGKGHGIYGPIDPAMTIQRNTGPGILDYEDVYFKQAPDARVLKRIWKRIKQKIQQQEQAKC